MTTPHYQWPLPVGTAKPDVVQWLRLLAEAVESTVKDLATSSAIIGELASSALGAANEALAQAGSAQADADAAKASAEAAQATANLAQPKANRARGGQFFGNSGAYGAVYIAFKSGSFLVPPIVIVTPVFQIQEQVASTQLYVGDGSNLPAVSKDGFWVAGLPINATVRVNYVAVIA